jgi:RNA polymerase sigma-70 factor (ECF subfamily)
MDENEPAIGCPAGDPGDFKNIVDSYGALAMAMAMNILGNRDDAEDACQDAFIQVYRNLENYDRTRSFKTWFYTILHRRCLDYLKRRRRSFELLKKAGREVVLLQPAAANPGPPVRSLPSDLLERLNARERTALCLWANEGYTAGEISEVLRCSSGTARVYLFQARKKIKKLLEQRHVSLQNG